MMFTLNFHEFLHTVYKCLLNSVVKISMMFVQYFEYYAIILRGGAVFLWTHCIPLLRHAVKKLDVDIITLQEIWHPEDGSVNIRDYTHQFVKLRSGKEGGGVAILTHKNVKVVHLKEYEVDNLEAIWVDVKVNKVRTVIGSVYIPPGDGAALDILDTVIDRILHSHNHLVIGMDANSRSVLWDGSCIGISEYQKSRKMGIKLEEIIDKHYVCS